MIVFLSLVVATGRVYLSPVATTRMGVPAF